MSRSERRAMVTSSADGFRNYLGLSSNKLRSAASLNSHWLRTLRPRNLKPPAATPAPPFCPPSICDIASKALVNQVTPYSPELVLHGLPFESRGDLILRYVRVSSFDQNPECQGRSKFGPLRRSKSRPVGEGVAVFVGRLERSLRSPFRAAQA